MKTKYRKEVDLLVKCHGVYREDAEGIIDRVTSHEHKVIYLASPYSHENLIVLNDRVLSAASVGGKLMRTTGHVFMVPVPHSHMIGEMLNNSLDHQFWLKQCFGLLERCDEIWIVTLNGWKESVGINLEIEYAKSLGIPIRTIDTDLVFTDELT